MKQKTIRECGVIILTVFAIIAIPIFRGYKQNSVKTGGTLAEFTSHIDQQIPAMMKKYSIPGASIALIQGGKISWAKAYGYSDLNQERKMSMDTILMAQSISKSVTAWGVMKLVEGGKIGLDDSITKHITSLNFPQSEFPMEKVTIRQLLSLSAGMPLGDFTAQYAPGAATPPLSVTLSGEDGRPIQMPGSSFLYSNMSYAVLQLLIEEVTGWGFAEYMTNEILIPLGMQNSSFTWSEEFRKKIATGYNLKGRPVLPYVYPYQASGGLFATVEDLAHFVSAGMIGSEDTAYSRVLKSESVQQLYHANIGTTGIYGFVADSYGLGHFIETLPTGQKAVWHGGQGNGWMTHFHSVPETGDGIVILTNSQRSWPFFSFVLSNWAKWNGFSSVGMGTIIRAKVGAQIVIALLFLYSLWQAWNLGSGVVSGKRRFDPFTQHARFLRIGQLGLSIALTSVLLWSARQDYLFIIPVFPILTNWLGASLLGVTVVSLVSAGLPKSPQGNCCKDNKSA